MKVGMKVTLENVGVTNFWESFWETKQSIGFFLKRLLPLRTVYTSLFSTGLHLQNSLLKVIFIFSYIRSPTLTRYWGPLSNLQVRHLEGFFDSMEKKRGEGDSLGAIMPDETQVCHGIFHGCMYCLHCSSWTGCKTLRRFKLNSTPVSLVLR